MPDPHPCVSELFDPTLWREVQGFEGLHDLTYHRCRDAGVVRVAFNRPQVRNAFRPRTVDELLAVLDHARCSPDVGVVLLTGNGPSPRDGGWAFCSGGDQRVRGPGGYGYDQAPAVQTPSAPPGQDGAGAHSGAIRDEDNTARVDAHPTQTPSAPPGQGGGGAHSGAIRDEDNTARVDAHGVSRLHILEVQRLIRFMPKVVIAVVPGWAAGGGHSLHVVCDLSIASAQHARFKQTDATVGSFDGGFGSAYLARQIGQKRAREVFFLAQEFSAQQAYQMGMVNAVVDHSLLETTALEWARQILRQSPTAIRMLKFAFNAIDDGLIGQQVFAGEATRLAYAGAEAAEGRDAFLHKRPADWSGYLWPY